MTNWSQSKENNLEKKLASDLLSKKDLKKTISSLNLVPQALKKIRFFMILELGRIFWARNF